MPTYHVTVGSQTMEVSEGTTYEQLAKQSLTNAAEEIPGDIVLVKVNDKLQEASENRKRGLHSKFRNNCGAGRCQFLRAQHASSDQ